MGAFDNVVPLFPRLPVAGGPRGLTFRDLAQEWLERKGSKLARPADVKKHVEHLRALWDLTEGELRPVVIGDALEALLRPKGLLSAATVNKLHSTGRRIIRHAMVRELWSGGSNPFDLVDRFESQEEAFERRALSLSEARAMLPFLRAHVRRMALSMLYLGLRTGEMKGLRWEDVDAATRTMTVRRSNGRNRTKTGKVRHLPIPDALWPVLEEAKAENPPDCPFVFPRLNGERQYEHAKLSVALRRALGQGGVVSGYRYSCRRKGCGHKEERLDKQPPRGCPRCGFQLWESPIPVPCDFYGLRHSAATLHQEAGANGLAVQIVMGHAPKSLTAMVYTHFPKDFIRQEMNRLKI